MRVSLIQSALSWEQPATNLKHFTNLLAPLAGQTDLVVLPEMFTTGFSMRAEALAEPMNGATLQWMQTQAQQLQVAIVGSFICAAAGQYFNRLVFMRPDGQYEIYDKRHLFAMAGEDQHFSRGNQQIIVEWQGWRICPLICYDLRFPVWSRNTAHNPFDLLIYIANWPVKRAHQWRALLMARAIENQAYTLGVNIAGTDGNGHEYLGDSTALDYSGQILAHRAGGPGILTLQLDRTAQATYRQQLPFLADADTFILS